MAKVFRFDNGRIKDALAVVFFSLVCIAAFWDVLLLKKTLLRGDYLTQFYPWLCQYSECLKSFTMPWWITSVGCGFPLVGEGQIGAFYPLNLILFFFLPFKAAYNYSFLFHLVMAGVFTYFYAKRLTGSRYGALVAAGIFCFGSSYAGAFINIAVLRLMSFFPLVLILMDRYIQGKGRVRWALLTGIVWGMQLLAGSPQLAVYAIGFSTLYFGVNSFFAGIKVRSGVLFVVSAVVIAAALYLPQFLISLDVVRMSNRPTVTADFALWNSFSPLAVSGLLSPKLGMMFVKDNIVFVGIIGLMFAFLGLKHFRSDRIVRIGFLLFGIAFLLALGKYNPLYFIFIKATNLSFFRCPSRWIVFATFFGAVLAAAGVKYFMKMDGDGVRDALSWFVRFLLVICLTFFLCEIIMSFFEPHIKSLFRNYVQENIVGSEYHRYSLEYYLRKIDLRFDAARDSFSFAAVFLLGWVAILSFLRVLAGRAQKAAKLVLVLAIFPELVFMGMYMKGPFYNIDDFSNVEKIESKILQHLRNDKDLYRILPFGEQKDLPAWAYFNTNGLFGIDSAGVYTPLVDRQYYSLMSGLGVVEDALGILPPSKEFLSTKIDMLRQMNIKYILSSMELRYAFLSEVLRENDLYLYEVQGFLPRVRFAAENGSVGYFDAGVNILKYGNGYMEAELDAPSDGYLIFAERRDRRWKAEVNKEDTVIHDSDGIFQAVKIKKGRARVVWKYVQELF